MKLIIIYVILGIILIWSTIRYLLYQKMINLSHQGYRKKEVNYLYDDYYHKSQNKLNHKLKCQISNLRKYFFIYLEL